MNSLSVVFLFAGIIILAALILLFISIGRRSRRPLDVEKYRVKCLAIEQQLKRDDPHSYHITVINADKLLDQALRECGFRGQTMGERMKNSAQQFSDRNGIWTAHKLRNRIAHEPDARATYDEARYALSCYRKALKDLGAI